VHRGRVARGLGAVAALALGVTPSCSAPGTADWIAPSDCDTNTPPATGNITINSAFDDETGWRVCFSVDWVDPGVDELGNQGSDAPNMYPGGYFSAEFTAASVQSVWLSEEQAGNGATSGTFETGVCSEDWNPGDTLLERYPRPEDLEPGEVPDYTDCADWDGDGIPQRQDCFAGGLLHFAVRMRDACGATSNTFTGEYALGTGRLVSTEGLPGCMTVPSCPGAEEPAL
jgi:hypothetical protein